MNVPGPTWRIIKTFDGFNGIKPTPNPRPTSNGSYNVKLTPAQYKIFQDNLQKNIVEHEGEEQPIEELAEAPKEKAPPKKDAPWKDAPKQEALWKDPEDDPTVPKAGAPDTLIASITVNQDPSTLENYNSLLTQVI